MERKKKLIFIVNPISGTHNKEHIIKLLNEKIDKEKYDFEIKKTERAGHAIDIAKQAAIDQVYAVIAIGGDGTINEIARSLVHTSTALGIIPCGSGNGFARHLHIPMDAKGAIEVINEGKIVCSDYGKINNIPFFCTCGIGFDAFVSFKFAQAGKRGLLTYIENTLQESLNYRPETYEIEVEGDEETLKYKAFLIACANASQYGNNAYIAPQASTKDGLMDITILEPFTVLDIPTLAFQLFNKTIDQNSRIKTFKCKKLRITRNKPGVIHFDGDPIMTGENMEVEIIEKGLHVITPDKKRKKDNNVLQKASDYFNGIKPLDTIMLDISQKNRLLMDMNKNIIKKIKGEN